MKSDTTQILNEADDMERRLSWVLFKQEQDARLYGDEGSWRPGMPLHCQPRIDHMPTPFEVEAYNDITKDRFNLPRCEPCGVFWKGEEPCWICGEHRPMGFELHSRHLTSGIRFEVNTEGFQQAVARATEAFVGQMQDAFADAGRALTMNETRRLLGTPEIRSNHDSPMAFDFVRYTEADAEVTCEIYRSASVIENWDEIVPRDMAILWGETTNRGENGSNSIQMPENLDLEAPVPVPMPVVDVFSGDSIGEMSRLIERHHVEWRRERADGTPLTERRRDYGG